MTQPQITYQAAFESIPNAHPSTLQDSVLMYLMKAEVDKIRGYSGGSVIVVFVLLVWII